MMYPGWLITKQVHRRPPSRVGTQEVLTSPTSLANIADLGQFDSRSFGRFWHHHLFHCAHSWCVMSDFESKYFPARVSGEPSSLSHSFTTHNWFNLPVTVVTTYNLWGREQWPARSVALTQTLHALQSDIYVLQVQFGFHGPVNLTSLFFVCPNRKYALKSSSTSTTLSQTTKE